MTSPRNPHFHLPTLASIGTIAYLIANVVHEGIGHGGACLLVGGITTELSTAYFDWDSSGVSSAAVRFVAAGGTIANLLAAVVFWVCYRFWRTAPSSLRYFFWLSMSVNYFVAAGYPLFSGTIGIGDWVTVATDYEPQAAWRVGLALFGATTYFWGVIASLRMLNPLLGPDDGERLRRANRLTVFPYIVGCIASTIGAFFNPIGIALVFTSAAAHFGGTSAMAWMAQMLRGPRIAPAANDPITIGKNSAWMVIAVVLLGIHIVVLGPGLG